MPILDGVPEIPLTLVIGSGALTVCLATALAYVLFLTKEKKSCIDPPPVNNDPKLRVVSIDKVKYPGGLVNVYYGSQTGTAESFAKQLEREGPSNGFLVHSVDLMDLRIEDFVSSDKCDVDTGVSRAVFMCATYGEGEPTENAQSIVSHLKEVGDISSVIFDPDSDEGTPYRSALEKFDYLVFGLGNRLYEHYNQMGKFFDFALSRVGGTRIAPLGIADAEGDLEADFEQWKEKILWPALKDRYLGADADEKLRQCTDLHPSTTSRYPDSPYKVVYLTNERYNITTTHNQRITQSQIHPSSRYYFEAVECPVTCVKQLSRSSDSGATVHVEIDISHVADQLQYVTADNLGVLPVNDLEVVERVARSMNYDLDATFDVEAAETHEWGGAIFPTPVTVRECLSRYYDLTGPPRRSDLQLLARYATDPTDIKALERMASKEGKAEYKDKILASYTGFVDVLQRCPSIQIPLEHFLDICPRMQTRFYTISCSNLLYPTSVHLTVATTCATRPDGTLFLGVASNHLATRSTTNNDTIRVYNRPSSFRLPTDLSRPIILIGPGTGIAPMRALLQERSYLRNTHKGAVFGRSILYFGCRNSKHDFLYEEELEAFQKEGTLDKLYTAFSREKPGHKVYVQHIIRLNAIETWHYISEQNAHIMVCGGVKMGQDVHDTIKDVVQEEGKLTVQQASAYMKHLAEQGRYIQELWA
jgi:NADPH-ferrihemoprotein reductase